MLTKFTNGLLQFVLIDRFHLIEISLCYELTQACLTLIVIYTFEKKYFLLTLPVKKK